MNVVRLTFRNAGRHRLRTVLTIVGMAIAVMAFAVIRTAIEAWYSQASASSPDTARVPAIASLSITAPLR